MKGIGYDIPDSEYIKRKKESEDAVAEIKKWASGASIEVDTIIRDTCKSISSILSINRRYDFTPDINRLKERILALIYRCMDEGISIASKRNGVEDRQWSRDNIEDWMPKEEEFRKSANRYVKAFEEEVEYFKSRDWELKDLYPYISAPIAYLMQHNGDIQSFSSSISSISRGLGYILAYNVVKLATSAVTMAYTNTLKSQWSSGILGLIYGYFGYRRSSYPCELCDENAGVLRPISGGMIYPLHPHCVCGVIYVKYDEIL